MTTDDIKVIDASLKRAYELASTLPEEKRYAIALEFATIRKLCDASSDNVLPLKHLDVDAREEIADYRRRQIEGDGD